MSLESAMASFKAAQFTSLPQDSLDEYAKALEAEKARAEEAERMYEVLKKIHEDYTEEFRVTQNQTQKLFGESEQRLQKADETLRELRRTILEQSRELAELRPNLLTPQKQEVLRLSVQAELDKQYQGKFRSLHDETVALKSKVAGLTYENNALQADLNAREAEFKRAKADLIVKYDRKLDDLKREKDAAVLVVPSVDMQRYRQLQRDNDQLELRIKGQQAELESTRLAESRRAEEAHATFKSQAQKITESTLKIENLKAELEVQKRHSDSLRARVTELTNENMQMSHQIEILNDEKLATEADRESLLNRHQSELANERGKTVSEKTALRREADTLAAEVEKLKGEVDSARQAVELQRSSVSAKEHETQLKLNQLAQKHATDIALVDQEKHVLESRLANAERTIKEMEAKNLAEAETHKEHSQRAETFSASLRSEIDSMRNQIAEYQKMELDFSRLKSGYSSLQQELKEVLEQISATEETFRDLQNEKKQLAQEITDLKIRHQEQDSHLAELQAFHKAKFEAQEKSWIEKRNSYIVFLKRQDQKLNTNQAKLKELSERQKTIRKTHRQYRKNAGLAVSDLIRAVKAKNALLDLAKDAVSPAEYNRVNDELTQLKQKMIRLKSMAVSDQSSSAGLQNEIHRVASAKSIAEHFDKIYRKTAQTPVTTAVPSGDDLTDLFGRLKHLGFSDENDNIDSSEVSDAESIAGDSDKALPVPSISL